METSPEGYRAIIFNAARDGNLHRLKIFLNNKTTIWLNECLMSGSNQTPPLLIAARNGHLDVVKHLVEKGADVSVKGKVNFEGEYVPGASPLWAAAAAGHLSIVHYLVEEGNADVNQTTDLLSTPLRAACYDGHFEIVNYLISKGADIEKPNKFGHTPLMIAAFKNRKQIVKFLLENGANPQAASTKGNTALHDAAESGCVEITKMLLEAGAKNLPDDYGNTPIIRAALAGHEIVLRILSTYVKPEEVRDAFKLYGATLVDLKTDMSAALSIWSQAMDFPVNNANEDRVIYEVYDGLSESNSHTDIRRIAGDPDAIRMQALIMRERILGKSHSETHYFLRWRGMVYYEVGQKVRCYRLWMHAIDIQQQSLRPFSYKTTTMVGNLVQSLTSSLNSFVINKNLDDFERYGLSNALLLSILDKTVFELERSITYSGDEEDDEMDELINISKARNFYMHSVMQVMLLYTRFTSTCHPKMKTDAENSAYLSIILRFVKSCQILSLFPLHTACNDCSLHLQTSFGPLIEQLIKAGAYVNAKNLDGKTPLHVAILYKYPRLSIINLLLMYGADILARSSDDVTCFELFNKVFYKSSTQFKLGKYISLLGLSANVLQRHYKDHLFREFLPHLAHIFDLY